MTMCNLKVPSFFLVIFPMLFFAVLSYGYDLSGDINGDNKIDLNETIYSLQVLSGVRTPAELENTNIGPLKWTSKAPLQTPRIGCRVISANGKLYAIGGYSGSTLKSVEEYDPGLNIWTYKASMNTARAEFSIATLDGKIYVAGGKQFNAGSIKTTEVYDPLTNSWQSLADMPSGGTATGTAINDKLYTIVYNANSGALAEIYVFNPEQNTWLEATQPPFGYNLVSAGLNKKLYALQGYYAGSPEGACLDPSRLAVYSPDNDEWILRSQLTDCRRLVEVIGLKDHLYVIGGGAGSMKPYSPLSTVEKYHPVTDQWSADTSLPSPLYQFGVGILLGNIYVVGGNNQNDLPLSSVFEGAPQ